MTRNGFFTGLDIGTSSIKVLVAELVDGEVNVIGVSNAKSKGVKDGIIVDIEAAATAIKSAISQAEEKAGISIKSVNVGLPANLLQVEPTQGMIPVTSDTKEITDQDVENVVKSALTKSMTPDREVITFVPEEFVVDGFQGIRDPRGMMTVIDMGGGQTSVATIRNQELQYTNVYQEGGDYVTKDISKVLKTSKKIAEGLKLNYGEAYPQLASKETFQVEVIGEVEPVEVTEEYLAQIISARLKHIFEQIKQDLERRHLLDLPGGIALIGGNAILPGIVELAQEVLGVRVKLYVPNQVGIRNPAFAHVISLSEFAGSLTEVNVLAQRAIRGDQVLRQQPIDFRTSSQEKPAASQRSVFGTTSTESAEQTYTAESATPNQSEEKPKLTDRFRSLIGSMFDE